MANKILPAWAPAPGVTLRWATVQDCYRLAKVMRNEDRRECADVGGLTPIEALLRSLACTSPTVAAYVTRQRGEVPVALFGVSASSQAGVGVPWLLGSPEIERLSRPFLRASRAILADLAAPYTSLTNIADERNAVHLRWLLWLGFTLTDRIPAYGPGHVAVIKFRKDYLCVSPL